MTIVYWLFVHWLLNIDYCTLTLKYRDYWMLTIVHKLLYIDYCTWIIVHLLLYVDYCTLTIVPSLLYMNIFMLTILHRLLYIDLLCIDYCTFCVLTTVHWLLSTVTVVYRLFYIDYINVQSCNIYLYNWQGIKAVIAESYERIHRSNLVGMGIIPFQYVGGQTADSLGLTGTETFSIDVPDDLKAGQELQVKVSEQGHFECHNECTDNWNILPNYFCQWNTCNLQKCNIKYEIWRCRKKMKCNICEIFLIISFNESLDTTVTQTWYKDWSRNKLTMGCNSVWNIQIAGKFY